LTVRLTWRDELATIMVGAAALLTTLSLNEIAYTNMSVRTLGGIVFALGLAACSIDRKEMAGVYGVDGRRRPPAVYVAIASLLGFAALVAGVLTLVSASEAMLITLVATIVALWLGATIRHAVGAWTRRPTTASS
jgi:hypothetical protein